VEESVSTSRRSFLVGLAGLAGTGNIIMATQDDGTEARDGGDGAQPEFRMVPIGKVEKTEEAARIRIFDDYTDGLLGLDGWSHVNVIYWFDRNDTPQRRRILRVHPRGDGSNPLTGVFACRSPVRPNLLALSVCKILSVEGGVITVDGIDAFDGTPVVDLKPVIPPEVSVKDLRRPDWTSRGR
jgi:tRNA (adenine37-N6)-methyltransferase